MQAIESYILSHPLAAWLVLIVAFAILAKSASVFVDSSVALARRLGLPRLVIGIVLVSFATTAPELAVSLTAAIRGNPEIALGNAVGSVICNSGLALSLAGLVALTPILIMPSVLRTSGAFLLGVVVVAFVFVALDGALSRWEGVVLLVLFAGYMALLFRQHRQGKLMDGLETETGGAVMHMSMGAMLALFVVGLAGILLASEFIVMSATGIARWLRIPESVIALTLVAFGTSVPEVATCVSAARKNHGAIAVGNILGANTLNICWVAGASAVANDLTLGPRQVYFMFPAMLVVVAFMLFALWRGYRLTKRKALALLVLYGVYLAVAAVLFPPGAGAMPGP